MTLTPDPSATVPPTGTLSVGLNSGQGNVPFAGCDSLPLAAAADGTNTFTSSCTTTFTAANSSTNLVAGYSGDTVFAPNGAVLVQQVNKAATTTTITSSSFNPSVAGQPVTFTATVSANPPGAGTPTGAVAFSDGSGNPMTCTGGSQTLDESQGQQHREVGGEDGEECCRDVDHDAGCAGPVQCDAHLADRSAVPGGSRSGCRVCPERLRESGGRMGAA